MRSNYQLDLLRTYRYVRLAMVLLVLLLGVSVFREALASHVSIENSISAYYYTPARAVFVAALCAIGTCLIVYRGNTDAEDGFLNASGFLAFVVAFVPTRPEQTCVASSIDKDVVTAVVNNAGALFVAGAVAFVVDMSIQQLAEPSAPSLSSKGSRAALLFSVLAFLGLVAFYWFWQGAFLCRGHDTAAILLFIGIVIVVGINGWGLAHKQAMRDHDRWQDHVWNRYTLGFILMLASIAVIVIWGPVLDGLPHWVFWLEAALITQFATFWITQTSELWSEPKRGDPLVSTAAQAGPAEPGAPTGG